MRSYADQGMLTYLELTLHVLWTLKNTGGSGTPREIVTQTAGKLPNLDRIKKNYVRKSADRKRSGTAY